MTSVRLILPAGAAAMAMPAVARQPDYQGPVHSVPGAAGGTARGAVFIDANRNSVLDAGDAGLAGVQVSNGREVVTTPRTAPTSCRPLAT